MSETDARETDAQETDAREPDAQETDAHVDGERPVGGKSLPSRRSVLLGGAGVALGATAIGVGLALNAAGGGHHASSPYSGDLRTVALATAMENQAVLAYRAVDEALRAGRLGPAVPALAAFVRTAAAHHAQHAATWNAILRTARKPVVTGVPLSGHERLMHTIRTASNVAEVVAAVQGLEHRAAQTHTAAAGNLSGTGPAVAAATTIAPVEAMHAATLGYVLGGRSQVASFLDLAGALRTTELTV
ncbi:ferritin-like domain-containing protein [Streptomyces fuscichromogenes]|uniref:ferritin-like domain-containing protein n=1 Tax=Streptomyces fuscichromogenes TaxID=1324013 RepID=UPI003823461B